MTIEHAVSGRNGKQLTMGKARTENGKEVALGKFTLEEKYIYVQKEDDEYRLLFYLFAIIHLN